MKAHHGIRLMIRATLEETGLWSLAAEELLWGTACVESRAGKHIVQIGGGPGTGLYQFEPPSAWDTLQRLKTSKHARLLQDLERHEHKCVEPLRFRYNLLFNYPWQTILARAKYLLVAEPLPYPQDLRGLAKYWKKYWNTHLGKGTVEDFIRAYDNP